ncbi:pilus assembly protein PilM [Paenibacillus sp. 19GGS1-52]|uniref:pilus assembly protein PilM n=1 Tax=Paenibacillus sp. 19GGS1-52 TaxID=2758563 RepID=UPI001EFBAC33|nr:pilus assembly protein PilM [Paenibacillus sp. 19GGS1-52]ULO07982.1 pilus assembly protein PilM [Paenibacillus sp. 19GGS1-52]
MLGLGSRTAGLAIEQTGIHYISLNNKSWEVRKKKFLPLPPGMIVENQVADNQALLDWIKQWVKKEGLRGSRVSLSIPPSQVIIRKMSIASIIDKQVEQLVKLEVETGLYLPFENPVYDYVTTEVDENESHLLVFAAPRQWIQDYVDVLENAGLKVNNVEVSATALARSIAMGHGEDFTETLLIQLEQSLLDIYMFHEGNPVFIRTINLYDLNQGSPVVGNDNLGNVDYMAEAAATMTLEEHPEEHLSPEQMVEITAEISRMLNFYQYSLHDGSTRIKNVLITGSPQVRKQLNDELVKSLTDIEIIPISLDQLSDSAVPDPELNHYRVAAGAALRSESTKAIDLLPKEDREALLFPYVAMALVGIWLLASIGTGIYYAANKGEISNGKEQIQGLQDRTTLMQVELAKLTNGGTGQLDRNAVIEELLKHKTDAVSILDELLKGLPKGAVFRDIMYTQGASVALTVNVVTMEDASSYLKQLHGMSFVKGASIQKLTEEGIAVGNGSSVEMTSTIMYSAIYQLDLSAVQQQDNAVAASQGEVDSNGTDQ